MALTPTTPRGKKIFTLLGVLLWCDIMLQFVLYEALGGAAFDQGYIKEGHYFLWNKSGPHFVEVAQSTWWFSYYQTLSVFGMMVLFMLTIILLYRRGDMK